VVRFSVDAALMLVSAYLLDNGPTSLQ